MKRISLILTLCLAVLTITVLIPGIKRCRAIAKCLDRPGARQRASIVPSFVHFDAPPAANRFNIGYATFDLDAPSQANREGFQRDIDSYYYRQLQMLNPSALLFRQLCANQYPTDDPVERHSQNSADGLDRRIPGHRTSPTPSPPASLLDEQRRVPRLFISLSEKASYRLGRNEVCCFTSPHARGIIYIGTDPTDRRQAILDISSPDGKLNVGFNARPEGPSTSDIGLILKHIAASFQFTIDGIPAPQQIAKRIADQGIPKRPTTQSDSDAPHGRS